MPSKTRERPAKATQTFEQPKEKGLYVYAEFESFKVGDKFEIPAGWAHDQAYEDLLLTKAKARQGMVFTTPTGKRVTLPVMEV
jgi:hypothetical protein